jgi:hypothetical protein
MNAAKQTRTAAQVFWIATALRVAMMVRVLK